MFRALIAVLIAGVVATELYAQSTQTKADPMTQRLAACVDVLLAVQTGQLAPPSAITQSIVQAFETANPGKTLGKDMKVVDRAAPPAPKP